VIDGIAQGDIDNQFQTAISEGSTEVDQLFNSQFNSLATGTVLGVPLTADVNACCLGLIEALITEITTGTPSTPTPPTPPAKMKPLSELLAGKLPEKALRRLRAIEKARAEAIAARTK
jgi:hypothetical protein